MEYGHFLCKMLLKDVLCLYILKVNVFEIRFFSIFYGAHLYFISQITDISFSLETLLAKITQILFAPLENYTSGSTIIIGEAKTNHKIAFIAYFSHDALLIVCVRKWPCRCGNTVKSRIIKCLMALKSGKMRYVCRILVDTYVYEKKRIG